MASPEPLDAFLNRYTDALQRVFRDAPDGARRFLTRGIPASEMRAVLATNPLSVFISLEHGGRGGHVREGLAMLERSAYESLAASLTMGINGALFLQPVSKYAQPAVQSSVFARFLEHQNMGGLMMTEPGYGSDALSMETAWVRDVDAYHIRGTKHWAGLTGLANYWLMTARERMADGRLGRDVDFFVVDTHAAGQTITVEERFENLGLYAIPYGRNAVDVMVPSEQRLAPTSTGLKMMLDLLHRSRMQFPGMAIGFLHRLADEALRHVRERAVGGKSLLQYDQVQRRIADLQASVTIANAMCLHASEHAGVEHDLAKEGLTANAVKTVITDRMQAGAQSLLQLFGGAGYKLDHLAGRSVVDSRPFQIFEGSNDILYEQIGAGVLQGMRRAKEAHLGTFLAASAWAQRAAEQVRGILDVRIDGALPQRRVVDLGRVVGHVISLEMVEELAARGYPKKRIEQARAHLLADVERWFTSLRAGHAAAPIDDALAPGSWLSFTNG